MAQSTRRYTGCAEHIALSRQAAAEGMVLLKNTDNALPLEKGAKVALFGQASVAYVKGGSGSGDVHCAYVHNVYDGFRAKAAEGKLSFFEPLEQFYQEHIEKDRIRVETEKAEKKRSFDQWDQEDWMARTLIYQEMTRDIFISEPEVPDALFAQATEFADTAVITFNRYSGEGWDRVSRKGDYYLTDGETALVERVKNAFRRCIVVLDVGGIIDSNWFFDDDKLQGVLYAWQAGMEGGMAIADILCGDVNPSGHLTDTFAKHYEDYPSAAHFNAEKFYVEYTEDIYVGYRYFETVPGAKELVNYPFGYGLSYTSFSLTDIVCKEEKGQITASVTVTNTGARAGKQVVQLYCSAPQGLLGKPSRQLVAFRKTDLLECGQSQTLQLSFCVRDMASFDDLGKICKGAYVLEKGAYTFHIGTSVRDTQQAEFVFTVAEDTVLEQLESRLCPTQLPCRMLSDGSFEPLPVGTLRDGFRQHPQITAAAPAETVTFDRVGTEISLDEFLAQFTDEELCAFLGGDPATGLCNTACFSGLERLGVPPMATADGPAGLRIKPEENVPTTAFPCATLLACTWEPEWLFRIGKAGGTEVMENGMQCWLTPALNIHRDPLCGRNFEYFSEDPLISGKMAAAKVRGMQSVGVAASVKHFACNNREEYRRISDSRVSERALREIYLRGFEICIKEADPVTLMSSYNCINGVHASQSSDLLEGILRSEWGFDGMVTTDWGIKNEPVKEVKAGNDMKMPKGYPEDLMAALESGELTRGDLQACARRILMAYQKLTK